MPPQFHDFKHFERLHITFRMSLAGRMTQNKIRDALVALIKGIIFTTLLGENPGGLTKSKR